MRIARLASALFAALVGGLLIAPIAAQQQPLPPNLVQMTATITSTNGAAATLTPLAGQNRCTIDVTGTWTGTLNFQVGTQWKNSAITVYGATTAPSPTIGISADGLYYADVTGAIQARVIGPTSTGSAVVGLVCAYYSAAIGVQNLQAPLAITGWGQLGLRGPFPWASPWPTISGSPPIIVTNPTPGSYVVSYLTPIFNVLAYGAKCNGSFDDTAGIQAAINAAAALIGSGGTVVFPNGTCEAHGLFVSGNHVYLQGQGRGDFYGYATPGTTIQYNGAAGGTLLTFGYPAGTFPSPEPANVDGGGIRDMALGDVSGDAATIVSFKGSIGQDVRNVSAGAGTSNIFLFTLDSQLTIGGSGRIHLTNIIVGGSTNGTLFNLYSTYADVFVNVWGLWNNGDFFHFGGGAVAANETDTNTLVDVTGSQTGGGTGYGLDFDCNSYTTHVLGSTQLNAGTAGHDFLTRGTTHCTGLVSPALGIKIDQYQAYAGATVEPGSLVNATILGDTYYSPLNALATIAISPVPSSVPGELDSSISNTAGLLWLGGKTQSGSFDFGNTISNAFYTQGGAWYLANVGFAQPTPGASTAPIVVAQAASPAPTYQPGYTAVTGVNYADAANSVAQSGTLGPGVIAQSTAAPTAQPGRISVTDAIYTGTDVVANAAATPTVSQSGNFGPTVVAQVTAAPTYQPGNTAITGAAYSDASKTVTQSGSKGASAVAQATAAPTYQPGYVDVSAVCSSAGVAVPCVNPPKGSVASLVSGSAGIVYFGNVANADEFDFGNTNSGAFTFTGGGIFAPNLATTSTNQNGYVCFTTGGKLSVDSTTCLASSARYKRDMHQIVPNDALRDVLALKPITFYYKKTGNARFDSMRNHAAQQMGFTAEQAARVDRKLAVYGPDGRPSGFRYDTFTAMLAGAIQAEHERSDKLEAIVDDNAKSLGLLRAEVRALWFVVLLTLSALVALWLLFLRANR